jgi:hypothetical protein
MRDRGLLGPEEVLAPDHRESRIARRATTENSEYNPLPDADGADNKIVGHADVPERAHLSPDQVRAIRVLSSLSTPEIVTAVKARNTRQVRRVLLGTTYRGIR